MDKSLMEFLAVKKSGGVAIVLSFFIPGAGSMYAGKVGKGIGLLVASLFGYVCLIIPGLIIHVLALGIAYNDVKTFNLALIKGMKGAEEHA